jgi:undecaprenyl phosphate-alpha-L-ara4FN deformylase
MEEAQSKIIGLRIDVDTLRGTKYGVPALCRILKKHNIYATFYFSVGPDNMGRHLWRLLKPKFLIKMLRSNAASLYGPEIIFMGTLWRGPLIGKKLEEQIRQASEAGHEIGLHAWDHHKIQAKVDSLSVSQFKQLLQKAYSEIQRITGKPPVSSAAPGWRCNSNFLEAKADFPFAFNSDCRGTSIFRPDNIDSAQIQIPVTLPTYDEVIGKNNISDDNYNDYILQQLKPDTLNVLTIHAEAEGGKCSRMFDDFLTMAKKDNWSFMPLGNIVKKALTQNIHKGTLKQGTLAGREGLLAIQS